MSILHGEWHVSVNTRGAQQHVLCNRHLERLIDPRQGGVNMKNPLFELTATDESGQGMVEYGLIVGLIAIIVIAVFVALGPQIRNMFQQTVDEESVGEGQAALSAEIYSN